jgi:hypothetical protein
LQKAAGAADRLIQLAGFAQEQRQEQQISPKGRVHRRFSRKKHRKFSWLV